jgi:hypothetical protein
VILKEGSPLRGSKPIPRRLVEIDAAAASSAVAVARRSISTHKSFDPLSRFGRSERLPRRSTSSRSKRIGPLTASLRTTADPLYPPGIVLETELVLRPAQAGVGQAGHGLCPDPCRTRPSWASTDGRPRRLRLAAGAAQNSTRETVDTSGTGKPEPRTVPRSPFARTVRSSQWDGQAPRRP